MVTLQARSAPLGSGREKRGVLYHLRYVTSATGRLPVALGITTLVALLLGQSGNAHALLSIESTIVRCNLIDHANVVNEGLGDAHAKQKNAMWRYSSWVLDASRQITRMPMNLYWTPKKDGGPLLRVETNAQDRKVAKLLSITNESVSAVVSLSDQATTRSMLVTVNFRREAVSAARLESNFSGIRADAFAFDCQFEPSADIVPGLLGERFHYLNKDNQ